MSRRSAGGWVVPTRAARAWPALILAVVLTACSSAPTTTPGPIATASLAGPASGSPAPSGSSIAPASPVDPASSAASASSASPASPVEGVLLDIDSRGLADVAAFTLRLDDGRVLVLRVGALENGDAFPVGHLAEHLATSSPVRVFFRPEGADLVVYRLEDAD